MIYEIDLLDDEQLQYINSFYKQSNFTGGEISNPSSVKNNYMMVNYAHSCVSRVFDTILKSNKDLYSIFLASRVSQIYPLWYKENCFYDYHIDTTPIGGVNGHLSMTCFLNDPDEYEGGELVIKIGSEEVSIKKKKGTAVLYNTGLWHKINPVLSGDRKVIVCWIDTAVKDSFIRNHLIEYGNMINSIDVDSGILEKLEHFRINLIRQYGE